MSKVYRQKCWTCTHSCNKYDCVWVETLNKEEAQKKQGCVFDEEGFITSCDKFEKENYQIMSIKLKALALGVSYRKYKQLQNEIERFGLNITPEELHKTNMELLEEKAEHKERKKQAKQDFKQWQEDKQLQKEIDRATAQELHITYKRYLDIKEKANEQNISVEQYLQKEKEEKTSDKSKAEKLQLSATYYCHLKKILKGTNKSVEQYLKERELQKQDKKEQDLQELEQKKLEKRKNSAIYKASELGISLVYYYNLTKEIKKQGLNITIEEYLKLKRERARQTRSERLRSLRRTGEPTQQDKAEKLGIKLQAYKDLVKEINRKKLNITPEELYKQKQNKKKGAKNDR